MKWISWIFKLPILIFTSFIKRNKASLKYLLEVVLKDELDQYFEKGYHQGYRHIDHSINICRIYNPQVTTIIDIGGANGTTARMFSKGFPQAKVYTFEPLIQNESILNKVKQECPNVIPIMQGVGNFTGNTTMHVAERITSSSMFELSANSDSEVFNEILQEVKSQEVKITSLDNYFSDLPEIGIIKIDVQGYELEVLKGGKKVLEKTDLILLELNNHDGYKGSPKYFEMDEFLRMNGFELFSLYPSTFDKRKLVEWDGLYIRKGLLNKA